MNCEQYVTNILQSAKKTLDSEKYKFLLSCSRFQVSQFYSQTFSDLQNTSISNDLNNVLYYYFIKAIINENCTDNYPTAIEYINKLQEAGIDTKLVEIQIKNQLINSVCFESKDSVVSVYSLISAIDKENTESNLQKFFENIHNFIKSKWDEEFDVIQYAGMFLSAGFDSRYTTSILNCLDQIFLNIFKKLYREGNLEGFLKFKKHYALYLNIDNKEIEEKYKALVGSRFLEIVQRGQVSQNFQETGNLGQRTVSNSHVYYSIQPSEEWNFRLINEVVQLDIILNRVLQIEVVVAGVKKRLEKLDLALNIKSEVNSLQRVFDQNKSLPFSEFCSIFCKISQFLAAFHSYHINFCFDPSCILLVAGGPAILMPDESFCVTPKSPASKPVSLPQNLVNCCLAHLMKDSIKYLLCSEEELEDLLRSIELIRARSQVTLEQIIEYLLTKL